MESANNKVIKGQRELIIKLGKALSKLAYYAVWDKKTELCGFDAEAGTKNFATAKEALEEYEEWKNGK